MMGNIFIKKSSTEEFKNKDLSRSLLRQSILERLEYLEEKLDNLDAMIYQVEANSTANLKVISNDVHLLYQHVKM
tara:strand:+ start:2602 stop:2826 length:225 start_codon:yes stop_codon:yes gene_type:complete